MKYTTLQVTNRRNYLDGSFMSGTSVDFSCIRGAIYDPFSGPLNIKCDETGRWSSYQQPKCLCKYIK